MNLLQLIISIAAVVFAFFGRDLYKRKKANLVHFAVFIWWSIVVFFFIFNQSLLNKFGSLFGIARGADLLVYIAIITLAYFYFELLHYQTKGSANLTRLVSAIAIQNTEDRWQNTEGAIARQQEIKIDGQATWHQPKQSTSEDQTWLASIPTKTDSNTQTIPLSRNDETYLSHFSFIFLIRAYNEATQIGTVIDEIFWAGYTWIVVVNDGSADTTLDVLYTKKNQYPDRHLIILHHPINRGPGAANKTLFQYIKQHKTSLPPRCVTYDADGQMDIADMTTFTKAIQENSQAQVFLWSRFMTGGKAINIPPMRRLISRGAKIVARFFNGIRVSDSQNGYKVIHKDIIAQVMITSDHFTYATEFIGETWRLNEPFVEVPVTIKYTDYSMSRGQRNSNAIRILIELIYKKFFFR